MYPKHTRPADDETRTWHEHDPGVEGAWAWGVLCGECRAVRPVPPDMPYFNIQMLKKHNALGTNTFAEIRDVLSNVKPEDMEKIDRVR